MQRDKVLSLIGLAMKAGKCASGEYMTESETKSGKARLGICVNFTKFQFVFTEIKIP